MTCDHAKPLIDLKAHHGDAPPPGVDFAALDHHLQSCPACRAELESLLRTRELLATLADEAPGTEEKNRMLLAIEQAAAADLKPSWSARLRSAGQLAAACIAVAAVLTIALQVGQTRYRGKPGLLTMLGSVDAPPVARMSTAQPAASAEGSYGIVAADGLGSLADGQSPAPGVSAAVTQDGARMSNSRAFWMFVRSGDVSVKQFVCPPSTGALDGTENIDLFGEHQSPVRPSWFLENAWVGMRGSDIDAGERSSSPTTEGAVAGAWAYKYTPGEAFVDPDPAGAVDHFAQAVESVALKSTGPAESAGVNDRYYRFGSGGGDGGQSANEITAGFALTLGQEGRPGASSDDTLSSALVFNAPNDQNLPSLQAASVTITDAHTTAPAVVDAVTLGKGVGQVSQPPVGGVTIQGANKSIQNDVDMILLADSPSRLTRWQDAGPMIANAHTTAPSLNRTGSVEGTNLTMHGTDQTAKVQWNISDPAVELVEQAHIDAARQQLALAGKSKEPQPPPPPPTTGPAAQPVRPDARPKLIKTGELALEVPEYAPAVRRIEEITATQGGFVADASTAEQAGGALSGKVVVRCPPERFEPLFAALKTVGRIEKEDARAADVTAEFVDLQARIASMQVTEDRLHKLIQEKTFLDEVAALLEVERELQRVRAQIEQMQGSLRVMENRIGLSTISVTLHEPPRTVPAATLFVEVDEVHPAAEALAKALAESGGRMISGQVNKNNDGSLRGEYGLTVSLDRFGSMLAAIQGLGRVSVSNISGWKAGDAATPWADKVPCAITLNLFERVRQLPSGSMAVEVDVASEALARVEPILPAHRASIVTNVTKRRGDGSNEYELKIRVPASEYAAVVAAIESAEDLGRITARNIAGEAGRIAGGAAEVLCELTLTLGERTRQLPTGAIALEVESAVEAVALLSPIIIGTGTAITSNETKRRDDGSHVAEVKLKVPAGEYAALLAEIEDAFVGPAGGGPASRPVSVGPASRPVGGGPASWPVAGRTIAKNISGEAGKIVGGAAQTLCDLTITLAERLRQVPAGKMLLQVDKFDTSRQQLSALVAERKLQVLAAGSDQRTDGTWIGGFRLGIKAADMESVVGRIESLGEVKSRQISGLNLGDLSTVDQTAVGVIEVTLAEKLAIAPPSESTAGVIRQRLREALEGLSGSMGMILYGLIVIAPWLAIVIVVGWLLSRTLRRRKAAKPKTA